jgi:hypothetical protein
MIEVEINPQDIKSLYIDCINQCFADWGGQDFYEWCFNRSFGSKKSDIIILKKNSEVIAGSGISYRTVLTANNSIITVGIMTGSWTLPIARGHGCFSRIIEESIKLTSKKGGVFLLAFVTEDNASFRRLKNAGSSLYPTSYLFSTDHTPIPKSEYTLSNVEDIDKTANFILKRLQKEQLGTSHFVYNLEQWKSQFIKRPGLLYFLTINDTNYAVIEKKGVFNRILFLSLEKKEVFENCIKALLQYTLNEKHKMFLFTTSDFWKENCMRMGFGFSKGYLTTLITNKKEFKRICPKITKSIDVINAILYDSNVNCRIAPWYIQTGDRM